MDYRISIGLLSIFAILLSSGCASLDKGMQQSPQKRTAMQRVERFATSVTHSVANAANDLLPIVSATSDELVQEVKSDLPRVTEELRNEVSRTFSFLQPRAEPAP